VKLVRPAPDTADREPDWRDQGICRDHDKPDLWYAGGNSTDARAQTREAQALCHVCPVQQACGQAALDRREKWGVWGGMTESQRVNILRQRGRGKGRATEAAA
jgi:WhiB family redox-sensing transcriptional regulator